MTATAVTELSLEQPAMLVCVNRAASMHAPLSAGVLDSSHQEVAARCGGQAWGQARFETATWGETEDGVPVLEDALASIICSVGDQLTFGTHTAFVGRVMDVRLANPAAPLVYFNGQFLSPETMGLSARA